MVGSVHEQQGAVDAPAQLGLVAPGALYQSRSVGREVPAVRVRAVEVLGPDDGTVGPSPPERRAFDRGGNTPPDHCVLETGKPEELGHLADVAEHVGQVPDRHRAAERVCAAEAVLEIPNDRLSGDHELVHEHRPRADRESPPRDECADPLLGLRADGQVVVDDHGLTVEEEVGVRLFLLEDGEQRVQ